MLLSNYYSLGKRNDINALAKLTYAGDGSRYRLRQELKHTPNKFSGFKNIEKIVLQQTIKWGSYQIVGLNIAAQGQSMPWQETMVCEPSCYISDKFFNMDESTLLMSSALYSYRSIKTQKNSARVIDKASTRNFIKVLPVLNNQASSFPLMYDIKIDKLNNEKPIFDKTVSLTLTEKDIEYSIALLLSSIQKMGDVTTLSIEDKSRIYLQKLAGNWADFNIRKPMSVFDYNYSEDSVALTPTLLHFVSFIDEARRWKQVSSLGYIHNKDEIFVMLKTVDDDNQHEIQWVNLRKTAASYQLVSKSSYPLVAEFMRSSFFGNYLIDTYKDICCDASI